MPPKIEPRHLSNRATQAKDNKTVTTLTCIYSRRKVFLLKINSPNFLSRQNELQGCHLKIKNSKISLFSKIHEQPQQRATTLKKEEQEKKDITYKLKYHRIYGQFPSSIRFIEFKNTNTNSHKNFTICYIQRPLIFKLRNFNTDYKNLSINLKKYQVPLNQQKLVKPSSANRHCLPQVSITLQPLQAATTKKIGEVIPLHQD